MSDAGMTLGIMQPYFLPYIGYWQLLAAVDRFVVYDNVKYTKKGWINRNRFLRGETTAIFTVPLKQGSDFLNIADRALADDFKPGKLLNAFQAAYRPAPFFSEAFPLIEMIVTAPSRNLFEYLYNSIQTVANYLGIQTTLIVSSTVEIDHRLRADRKVLALCDALGATRYINSIGGRQLYSVAEFAEHGVELKFIRPRAVPYRQFSERFVPSLSIVDAIMFNSKQSMRAMLGEYDLV
jgi:WbqC-like protein